MGKKILIFAGMLILIVATKSWADENEPVRYDLGEIIITATRIGEYESELTSNIMVIGKDKMEISGAQTVADILKEEVGINIYDAGTDKTVKVDIRGFADTSVSNILVLVNGRKVNSIDISGPDWLQIPLECIERIEIVRGAGSVLYGDNAVGGVVNIITKKGVGPISWKIGAMYGSYDTQRKNLEISGSRDKFSYYLYSKYQDTDGYRDNSDLLTKDFTTRLSYMVSENLSFDFTAGWHEDDYGMPGGLDDVSELVQYGRRGSTNLKDFASTKDRYVKLSFDAQPKVEDRELGRIILDISRRNRDSYSLFDYGIWGTTTTKYMIDTTGVTLKYVYDKDISDKEFNFVAGIDYHDAKNKIKGGGSGAMSSSDDLAVTKKDLGFYVYSEYELFNNIFISGGTRYQKAKYTFDQRAATVRHETKHPSESIFMGGMKYVYAEGSNIHFSVQETFRFLATDEWYSTWTGLNTNLKQQTGIQYEAGIKHSFGDASILSVTPYWINIQDEIYLNPDPSPGQNENYDKTGRRGVELGIRTDLLRLANTPFLDKLVFFANYTYQESKFKNGPYSGRDIPMVPQHQATSGLNIGFSKNYNISLTGNYVGKRYAINDTKNETSKIKPYFTLNGKIAYNNDSLEIFLRANNIFNKKYSSYVVKSAASTKKDHYPSSERNFEIGISYKF